MENYQPLSGLCPAFWAQRKSVKRNAKLANASFKKKCQFADRRIESWKPIALERFLAWTNPCGTYPSPMAGWAVYLQAFSVASELGAKIGRAFPASEVYNSPRSHS
jgi:hypothetical protein